MKERACKSTHSWKLQSSRITEPYPGKSQKQAAVLCSTEVSSPRHRPANFVHCPTHHDPSTTSRFMLFLTSSLTHQMTSFPKHAKDFRVPEDGTTNQSPPTSMAATKVHVLDHDVLSNIRAWSMAKQGWKPGGTASNDGTSNLPPPPSGVFVQGQLELRISHEVRPQCVSEPKTHTQTHVDRDQKISKEKKFRRTRTARFCLLAQDPPLIPFLILSVLSKKTSFPCRKGSKGASSGCCRRWRY